MCNDFVDSMDQERGCIGRSSSLDKFAVFWFACLLVYITPPFSIIIITIIKANNINLKGIKKLDVLNCKMTVGLCQVVKVHRKAIAKRWLWKQERKSKLKRDETFPDEQTKHEDKEANCDTLS